MAGDSQIGNIVYQVEVDVAKLIDAQRKVNDRLDGMDERFRKSAQSSDKLSASMSKLAGVVSAAISVQQVAKYADAWTTVNNKLANSVRVNEQLAQVTQRVFDLAQDTRAGLDATASLYARLERATRSYGTSVDDIARLTKIINQGFVVSGATAEEASNAVIQLSQGLAAGALRGEEFNSVTEQGSRLANALADSLGVNIGQLRAMAAEGKLTTDVVVKGLLSQGDAIGKEFANTTTTIGQALQVASNNITKFIGSSTTVQSTVAVFNSSVVSLSENLDSVAAVIGTVAAVVGSRYVSALTLAVAGQVRLAASAFAASTSLSAFGAAASLARGALGLIGGPAGAAMLAASAIFYFYQKAQEARKEAISLADSVDSLTSKMKDMSATEMAASIAKLRGALPELTDAVDEASDAYDKASDRVANLQREIDNWGYGTKRGRQAADALTSAIDNQSIAAADLEKAQRNLSQTQSAIGIVTAEMNGQFRQGIDLLKRHGEEAGVASGMMNQLGKQIGFATREQEKFNAASLKIERPKGVQDYLDKLQEQVELQSELNDKKRAQLKAEQDVRKLGGTDADIRLARDRAAAEYDYLQAQQKQKNASKESASEGKKAATQAESVAQKLSHLKQQAELAATSTQDLSREQAILRAEQSLGKSASSDQVKQARDYAAAIWDTAAAIKARNAIPELKESADYAAQKSQLEMLKGARDAQGNLLISQRQYNQESERLEQEHQVNLAKIRSGQAVTPQQEAKGLVDPVQQLANENAQKLALIQQFEQQRLITEQQSLALRNDANTKYEQQRVAAQWEIWRNQSTTNELMASAVDGFASQASSSLTGLINGTQSATEAFQNLGNSIINSVIQALVEVGIQYLKNAAMAMIADKMQANSSSAAATQTATAWAPAAAAASIATFGGAAVAGIAGMVAAYGVGLALAGKRKNGGPVSAGSMYQVGEGGKPEIYQASNGSQYMIPGDNGKVISNKDMMGGGGGLNLSVNITNTNGSFVDHQVNNNGNGGISVDVFIADMDNGGPMSQAITRNHQAPRKATS